MTGQFPAHLVDHRNRVRSDDRWKNLRDATSAQNSANSRHPRRKHFGLPRGVYPHSGKFQALLGGGYLGRFATMAAASVAYSHAAQARYGEFSVT
ncbi:MAG: HNH endonuclease [Steroidobacteraceae bacterium]